MKKKIIIILAVILSIIIFWLIFKDDKKQYKVSFKIDGESFLSEKYHKDFVFPEVEKKADKAFYGWYTNEDYTGDRYDIFGTIEAPKKNITLYGKYVDSVELLEFTLQGTYYSLDGFKPDLEVPDFISLPNQYNDITVERISDNAFMGIEYLKQVVIPNEIRSIGISAFEECGELSLLHLPFIGKDEETNNYLGYLFGAPDYLSNTSYVPDSLQEVIISKETVICSNTFYNCDVLERISFKEDVKYIGEKAFYGCDSIKYIELPDYLESDAIALNSFEGCKSLESIYIPYSIKKIGANAFKGCSSLTTIYYNGSKENWDLVAKNLAGNEVLDSSNDNQATMFYYSATKKVGNYFYFEDGAIVEW